MARKRWLPEHVTEYRDRHGKARYRFRKAGMPTYHFRNAPGTEKFREELEAARNGVPVKRPRYAPFTYDELIDAFYRTAKWKQSADSTQKTYRSIIERFRAANGDVDVRKVTVAAIDRKLSTMSDTPAAANNLRKALKRLHRFAVKQGWRSDNPADATDAYKAEGAFHCWTETEIDAFDARWPMGTRERLAKELLLATALRKTDVLEVGHAHRTGDALRLHHSKNDSDTVVPIGPDLQTALDALPGDPTPYLQTQFGKPFSSTGFYNWFKRACVKAGIPHCSPHGLRKATSRRLAESGATSLQGRAVTGHKTDKEFARYAESANKQAMAHDAMANVHSRFAKHGRKTADLHGDEENGGGQG